MNSPAPSPEVNPPVQPCLNPWRDKAALLGLGGVCGAAVIFGFSPLNGIVFGLPLAICGLVGLIRLLRRNRPEHPGFPATLYWLAGAAGVAGAFFSSWDASVYYISHQDILPAPLSPIFNALFRPVIVSLLLGGPVVAVTARAHRLSARAGVPLALYWLSFAPVALFLMILLLKCSGKTGQP